MADADVNLTFGVGNPDDIVRQLEAAIDKAAKAIGTKLSAAISKSITKAFSEAFGKLDSKTAQAAFGGLQQRIVQTSKSSQEFADRIESVTKRTQELQRSFSASGFNQSVTGFFDANLRELTRLQETLNRTDLSPELRRQFQLRFDTINSALVKESQLLRRASIVQQQADSEASKAARANLETASRERIENLRAESRQQALASQQRTTELAAAARLELANVQTKNRQILINERAAAAQRVEFTRAISRAAQTSLRFIVQQTQFLSRTAVNAFVGIQRAGTTAFKGIANAGKSFFGVFRREQNELVNATNESFRRRRAATDTFYRSQEQATRRSLARQKAETLRVAEETNRGVLGIAQRSGLFGFGIGAGIGFRVSQAIRSQFAVGGDFVQVLAVLQAQLGLTEEAIAGVREQSIELGNDLTLPGVSAADAVKAISLLVKQFGSLGDQALPAAQAAARGVLLLSRATGTAADEAAGAIGAAVNTFGVAADQASVIADQFATTVSKAAGASFLDLTESIKNGATVFVGLQKPALGAAGALLEFQTVIASLSKGGLIGAEAGTQLRSLLQNATRGAPQAEEALASVAERAGIVGSVFFDQQGAARAFSESLDILRKGTQGLTDAERNLTLQRIFGTFGINAANILLAQSSEEYAKLRERIEQAGLATEVAAAQNTGLRGALDALGSVIETQQIRTYERYQEALAGVILKFSELLDAFFNGRGVFGIIKTAINGVVVALGGLVVIKGVIELVGLLRRRLTLLLSPIGLFVAALAAIAGTFNVLRRVSEPFRNALSRLGETFSSLGQRVKEALGLTSEGVSGVTRSFGSQLRNVLERVGFVLAGLINLFIDRVIPALVNVATTVTNVLRPAFDAVRTVIEGTFVPAIQIAWAFIEELLLPALNDLANFLGGRILSGLQNVAGAIADLGRSVQPLVQPAIDAFQELGSAIGAAFQGDFGQLGGAIRGIGGGFAQTARNIGSALLGGLDSLKEQISKKFAEIFSPENVFRGAQLVLRLVEGLGRILGLVVTDPRLLAAVAALGGVAAVVAFRFIEGFARGVATNIGKIAEIGADLALELGKALLNPKNLALAAGVAIVASSLFSLLRPALSVIFSKIGFIGSSALAGAAGGDGAARSKFTRAGAAAGRAFGSAFSDVAKRLVGQGVSGVAQTNAQRRTLGGIDDPANDPTRVLVGARGGAPRAFVTALFGGRQALDRAGQDAVKTAYASANKQLRIEFAKLSRLSQTLGRGPLSAGAARVTEDTIRRAREQLDPLVEQYGRAGIAALRLRATTKSAFQGLKEIVGSAGAFLSRDLTGASNEFEKFRARVRRSFTQLKAETGSLVKAIGSVVATGVQGAVAGAFTGQALGQAETPLDFALNLGTLAATSLAIGAINPAAGVATAGIGLLTAAFTRSGNKAKAYVGEIEAVSDALVQAGGDQQNRLDVIVQTLNQEFFKSERVTAFLNRISIPTSKFAEALVAGRDAAALLFDEIKKIPSVAKVLLANGISSVEQFLNLINGPEFVTAREDLSSGLEEAGINIDDVAGAFENLAAGSEKAASAISLAQAQVDRANLELATTSDNAEEATRKVNALFAAQRDLISAQLSNLNSQLELATRNADDASRALQEYFGGEYQSSFEGLLNRLILDAGSIGQSVAEGLAEGGRVGEAQIADTLNARLLPQLGEIARAGALEFKETFGDTFVSPTEGTFAGIDQGEWLKLQIIDAVNAAISDPTARKLVAEYIGGLFDQADTSLVVDEAIVNQEALAAVESQVAEITKVQLEFEIDAAQIEQELQIATGEIAKIAAAGPSFINLINTGKTLGGAVSEGLTKGMLDPRSIRNVSDAAARLGRTIEQKIKDVLEIKSPSRVMFDVGSDVGKGLADGIESSTPIVTAAAGKLAGDVGKELQVKLSTPGDIIRDLGSNIGREIAKGIADEQITIGQAVSDAVASGFGAFTQDERLGAAVASGASEIFKRNLPTEVRATGVTELDLRQAFGGLAPAITQFVDSVSQVNTDIASAQEKQRKGETLTASERALAAALPTSLGADIAGSRNVSAFVQAGTTVRNYATTLLEAGRSIESVVFETKAWRDNLVDSAIAAGFSADQVKGLVEQLGLSNEQLDEFARQAKNLTAEAAQPATSARAEEEQRQRDADAEQKRQDELEEEKRKAEEAEEQRKKDLEDARKREEDMRERLRRLEDPRLQRNLVQNISVTVPYGDPQAVALATANRVAATTNRR